MTRVRVIPTLLLRGKGFVKTVKFAQAEYLGDCINIVRIFNDKEADELAILDIEATPQQRAPHFDLLRDLASECFMPLCYGGGIRSLADMRTLFLSGFEKVCINTAAFENPDLVTQAARQFGSQSVVVSIDVRRNWRGQYEVVTWGGKKRIRMDPGEAARRAEELGAGEILLTSIDRDGTYQGYDLESLRRVTSAVRIPVIASGGAGNLSHFSQAVQLGGASAVAAGSFFVFHGPRRAVLINMPSAEAFDEVFSPPRRSNNDLEERSPQLSWNESTESARAA